LIYVSDLGHKNYTVPYNSAQTSARHSVAEKISDARSFLKDGRQVFTSRVESLQLNFDQVEM